MISAAGGGPIQGAEKSMPNLRSRGRICLVLLISALLTAGCAQVGPDYLRPETNVSENWLEAGDQRVKTEGADYRNWWQVFKDPSLDRLIDTAYRENLNLRIAGVRVLEARAQLGIATGQLYPQTQQATGSVQKNRESAGTPIPGTGVSPTRFGGLSSWQSQVGLTASWEIDFWGKIPPGHRVRRRQPAGQRWPIMTAPWSASPPTWRISISRFAPWKSA